jgi:hypothetical protein
MAVSYISFPAVSPDRVSFSYPGVIVVDSTVYGTVNVTQHRFRLEILDGATVITNLYTVVDDEATGYGRFDISDIVKAIINISNQSETGGDDITKIASIDFLDYDMPDTINVNLYEQYYLSGVWTQNSGGSKTFEALRGFTDKANDEWFYENIWRLTGLENVLPFSGKQRQVWPFRTDGSGWVDPATNRYLFVELIAEPGTTIEINDAIDRQAATLKPDGYVQLYHASSLLDTFEYYELRLTSAPTNAYPIVGGTVEESYKIYKNIDACIDDEILIMFLDRFYQWSFMSFPKKNKLSTSVTSTKGELANIGEMPGRFRYNVEASDLLTLNTDWLDENQNDLVRDLMQSEATYLVDQTDGSLEHVTIETNSVTYKTRRNDLIQIQYTMQFRKSLDNFIP